MAQIPQLGQENIHEILRMIIPGYFALFLIYTIYPDLFQREVGLALAFLGGIGLGLIVSGLNLQTFLPSFRPLQRMLKSAERKKISRLKILIEEKENFQKKNNDSTKLLVDKDNRIDFLWSNFSYGKIPDSTRARQRIYASMFYLFANCTWILLGYIIFVSFSILANLNVFLPITNLLEIYFPQSLFMNNFIPNTNLILDIVRLIFSIFLCVLFWKKSKKELESSMKFQEASMLFYLEELTEDLTKSLIEYEKIKSKWNKIK